MYNPPPKKAKKLAALYIRELNKQRKPSYYSSCVYMYIIMYTSHFFYSPMSPSMTQHTQSYQLIQYFEEYWSKLGQTELRNVYAVAITWKAWRSVTYSQLAIPQPKS